MVARKLGLQADLIGLLQSSPKKAGHGTLQARLNTKR